MIVAILNVALDSLNMLAASRAAFVLLVLVHFSRPLFIPIARQNAVRNDYYL